MKYLLDTHALIWLSSDGSKFSEEVREVVCAADTELYVSMASLWEMQIKVLLGKMDVELEVEDFWSDVICTYRIEALDIKREHILNHRNLPAIHKDPFDRMLVSQAQVENMMLVTRDQHIPKYDVNVLW